MVKNLRMLTAEEPSTGPGDGTGLTPVSDAGSAPAHMLASLGHPRAMASGPWAAGDQVEPCLLLSAGAVRASSVFPILSVTLLFFGGLCVAASEFHRSRHNVILSAGIFFVSAGLSNIIGIIVYISANAGDPGQRDSKKSYSYGWSFYFGAFSFIIAEIVGVVAVHIYIEKHQQLRAKSHSELLRKSTFARLPPYRHRFRRRSSSRSTEPRSRDLSPTGKGFHTIPSTDISMFTLSRDPSKITMGTLLNSDRDHAFLQFHNSTPKDFKEALHNDLANRRTTPV
uniref:Voltage-dependent calcium channel gamma-3 subunit n=1 Tax=Molossus molossus TaxID=27622 RepID=A0A7J8IXE1_MOLMO|nr:calcium voltage-gated channel auxiliary subunit gamma 3 [Molossus molossus]